MIVAFPLCFHLTLTQTFCPTILIFPNYTTTHLGFCDWALWLRLNQRHMQLVIHELLNSCRFTHLVIKPIILSTRIFLFWFNIEIPCHQWPCVATLALGLWPRQKGSQGRGPRRAWKWRLTLPSELSFWELESQWTPEPSKSDCKGQNTLHWGDLYIIKNIWKCRCLKWARMTRLDICNTSYGKKKGQESNW
jgi:hypothetical protein